MAEATEEQFREKVEEVVGNLGVAVAAVVRAGIHTSPDEYFGFVRQEWKTLGRSFSELLEMKLP